MESATMSPPVARYIPILEGLRPGARGNEQRMRCGILYLRDRAIAGRDKACWEASLILGALESMACVHATRSMALDQLDTVHRSMLGLMNIATMLERHGPAREAII